MTWTVYLLIDPRDGEIRYVGCSGNLWARYSGHLCSPSNWLKQKWFESLRESHLKPILEPLVSTEDWYEGALLEETWVRRLGLAGCKLVNSSLRDIKLSKGQIQPMQLRVEYVRQ